MPDTPLIYVDLYEISQEADSAQSQRAQRWRWRAINGGNQRILAESSEAYTNPADAIAAIEELFGTQSNVYLRQTEQGNQLLRLATNPT